MQSQSMNKSSMSKGMMNKDFMSKGMMMEEKLMKVSCAPECGFSMTSHDENELIGMIKAHAKNMHNKKVTSDEVRSMMEMI